MVRALLVACTLAVLVLSAGPGLTAAAPAGTEAPAYTPERMMSEFGKAVVLIVRERDGGAATIQGTGFLVTDDGRIVTNYHVVQGAYPAQVKLPSGDIYDDISVISYDPRRDLAVLKIRGFSLPTVRLGNSDEVKVGEKVVVIGNPLGLANTISDGLLNAIRPNQQGFTEFQVTAPISPGSSGGPVLNARGEAIGVTCSQVVGGQNLNFCIPINYARAMISGPVKCTLRRLPKEGATAVGLGPGERTPAGGLKLLIEAAALGLQAHDASEGGRDKCRYAVDYRTAWVDPGMYQALEKLDRASRKLSPMEAMTGPVGELATACAEAIARMGEAQQDRVELFLHPWRPNSNALLVGADTAYEAAWGDLAGTEEEFNRLCRELAPELLSSLPPALTSTAPLTAGQGSLGLAFPGGVDSLCVTRVGRGEAADKAGLRVADVVLGVVDGPAFTKQAEFITYLREHAGEKIRLRYLRRGKERVTTLVPRAYQP